MGSPARETFDDCEAYCPRMLGGRSSRRVAPPTEYVGLRAVALRSRDAAAEAGAIRDGRPESTHCAYFCTAGSALMRQKLTRENFPL